MNLNNQIKLRAALDYLKGRKIYACALRSGFTYVPAAGTNVKETIDTARDRLHDTIVWRRVTGK